MTLAALPPPMKNLAVPVMAVQAAYRNKKSPSAGFNAPVPSARITIIEDTAPFPTNRCEPQTNALLDVFLASLPAR